MCGGHESEEGSWVDAKAAGAGAGGDCKVWSTPVDEMVRVRTGERGSAAI